MSTCKRALHVNYHRHIAHSYPAIASSPASRLAHHHKIYLMDSKIEIQVLQHYLSQAQCDSSNVICMGGIGKVTISDKDGRWFRSFPHSCSVLWQIICQRVFVNHHWQLALNVAEWGWRSASVVTFTGCSIHSRRRDLMTVGAPIFPWHLLRFRRDFHLDDCTV